MSIGNERAFSGKEEKVQGRAYYEVYHPGMTYRQWLIGQVATGLLSNQGMTEAIRDVADETGQTKMAVFGKIVKTHADAIISRLDAEGGE